MNSWWRRRTLRFRLAAWYAVGGTLLIAVFSATLYGFVWVRVAAPQDLVMREDLAVVRQNLRVLPDGRAMWDDRDLGIPPTERWSEPWFELWNGEGELVARRWSLDENALDRLPLAPVAGRETLSIFNLSPELQIRSYSVPLADSGPQADWRLRVMRVHERAREALAALVLIIAIALPAVVACLVVGGYIITRRWLRPLDRMVGEATQITAEDLSRRLPVENEHDELGRLASVFNVTLDRLEGSFVTLDRFVTDASHELRTPLTTLRSVGEVGLRRGRTVEEYHEIIASMLEEAQRLQLLVQRLLELARVERGPAGVHRTRVRVGELLGEGVGDLSVLAENKGQKIAVRSDDSEVSADPLLLSQAFRNLLDNAVKYSPPGSLIEVEAARTDGVCRISVRDQGPGVAPEHRSHLGDRFYRTDSSRDRAQGGFGLGLAITRAYMRALGGTLEYEPAPGGGSIFQLSLPAE